MDDALADWLALREAADWRARSETLTRALAAHLPSATPIRVLDLATGTGSNLRYLLTRLPSPQSWVLVDRSPALLGLVSERTRAWSTEHAIEMVAHDAGFSLRGPSLECHVETCALDLNLPLDDRLFAGQHLVTASALLDLVSTRWLQELAARCRDAGAAALFALSYDGRSAFEPFEPEDDRVRQLLNRHQLRDKGLGGPAAGPAAHAAAVRAFEAAGFSCRSETSDWALGPDARHFQRQLVEGLAAAATEESPDEASLITSWLARRLAHVDAWRSQAIVGHADLAAWPLAT